MTDLQLLSVAVLCAAVIVAGGGLGLVALAFVEPAMSPALTTLFGAVGAVAAIPGRLGTDDPGAGCWSAPRDRPATG